MLSQKDLCVPYLNTVWLVSIASSSTVISSSSTLVDVVSFKTIVVDYILINLRLLLMTYQFPNPKFIYQDNSITSKSQLALTISFLPIWYWAICKLFCCKYFPTVRFLCQHSLYKSVIGVLGPGKCFQYYIGHIINQSTCLY